MKEIAKEMVKKDRQFKTKTVLKKYDKKGQLRKDLDREVEYTSQSCDCDKNDETCRANDQSDS